MPRILILEFWGSSITPPTCKVAVKNNLN